MEDAGAEIRDQIDWMYGSGFPKSLDISKGIDAAAGAVRQVVGSRTLLGNAALSLKEKGGTYSVGLDSTGRSIEVPITIPATDDARTWSGYGTNLKPAHEPICLAMKSLDGTYVANALTHGVAGINIDGTRIGDADLSALLASMGDAAPKGRWPANVILSHSPECRHLGTRKVKAAPPWNDNRGPSAFTGVETSLVHHADSDGTETVENWECADDCMVRAVDEQSGSSKSSDRPRVNNGYAGLTGDSAFREGPRVGMSVHADEGGASRFFKTCNFAAGELALFFYCAKASRFERDFGCEGLPVRSVEEMVDREEGSAGTNSPRAGAGRKSGARNHHPTVKPIALTKYLATLQLPPARVGRPRRILVPFSGVGSEMIGALRAGWECVEGIELEPDYLPIAAARLARWQQVPAHMEPDEVERHPPGDPRQIDLFGGMHR
jgi:site-specific DNA-methyltransferase (adenine-specific)